MIGFVNPTSALSDSIVSSRARDVRAALTTLPTTAIWRRCGLLYILFVMAALPIGLASGLLQPSLPPLTLGAAAGVAARLALHPVLTEELFFRALLLPRQSSPRRRLLVLVALSLSLYVASHPLNAMFFWPAAFDLFSNPYYLAMTALLGLTCSAAYLISGSIWPSVAMHWLTVALWMLLLGGQALLQRFA